MLYSAQECFKVGDDVLRVVVQDVRDARGAIEGFLIRPNKPNYKLAANGAYRFVLALNVLGDLGYKDQLPTEAVKAWMFDIFLT